ncbi:hypothetical protein FOZ61_007453 [Perkinsus olseni]|uniref:Uncharacterized protein n=1 Tax=Perkinsus olseni TaxID=32597 RepID=A0A7J6L917_PEROL|nr:hypothetical protein FOZ61_007453 [Perkinsus olseni]
MKYYAAATAAVFTAIHSTYIQPFSVGGRQPMFMRGADDNRRVLGRMGTPFLTEEQSAAAADDDYDYASSGKASSSSSSGMASGSGSSYFPEEPDYLKKYHQLKVLMHERDNELRSIQSSLVKSRVVLGRDGQLGYQTDDGRLLAIQINPPGRGGLPGVSIGVRMDTAEFKAKQRALWWKKFIFLVRQA